MSILLLLAVVAAPVTQQVGVLPLKGRAPATVRADATKILEQALRGLPGLEVTSFANVDAMLGAAAARRIEACLDDACFRRATAQIKTDLLIAGELDVEERTIVRLRLLETGTTAPPRVRVTKEVDPGEGGLVRAVSAAVAELFPDRAKAALGTIVVTSDVMGASVFVDGVAVGTTTADPDGLQTVVVRVRPGQRRVEVRASGHDVFQAVTEVIVGGRSTVSASLQKNRSNGPLILGGLGVVAVGVATIVGFSIQSTANDWKDACAGRRCDAGFTRERYESDRDAVARGRLVTNGLLVVGIAAVVGAAVWYLVDPGEDPVTTLDASSGVVGWSW